MSWDGLYVFLFGASAGSVITTLLKTWLDELISKRDSKRLLRKIFFERRLQIAETSINNWQYSIELHSRLIYVYDIIAEKKEDNLDLEFITSTWKSLETAQAEATKIRVTEGYKILAYHDLETLVPFDKEVDAEYTTLLSRISFEGNEVKRYRDMAQPPVPGVDWNAHKIIFDMGMEGERKHMEEIRQLCKRLRDLGNQFNDYYRQCILVLRNEIQKDIA